ncbi:MAG: amidohydrolase family protein [Proteobacteria bacterium]|nr:amidohydrolase family protein [Pseudomonadota bacterium]
MKNLALTSIPNPDVETRIRVQSLGAYSECKKYVVTSLVISYFLHLLYVLRSCAIIVFPISGLGLILVSQIAFTKVTIIHNVSGNTINQSQLVKFTAIAFADGKVLQIGSNAAVMAQYPHAKIIDGQGQAMLPGFNDASVDLLYSAKLMLRLDLRETKSKQQVLAKVKKFSEDNPDNIWVIGYGWDHKKWQEPELPHHQDLDDLKQVKFIWLLNDDGIGWANKELLRIAKVDKIDKQLYGKNIIFDKQGNFSGIFLNTALTEIQSHVPRLTKTEYTHANKSTLNTLAKYGITSINVPNAENKTIQWLKKMASLDRLSSRINATITSADKGLDFMLEQGSYHNEKQFLHIHSVQYYIDGSFENKQAYLKKPYINSQNTGINLQPESFINAQMQQLTQSSWQVNLQAFGDKANKIALDLITNKNLQASNVRHQVENATLIAADDITTYKDSNAIISILPNKAIKDMTYLQTILGKARTNTSNQWKTLANYGVKLISGSSYPNNNPNPFYAIHALVTRKTPTEHTTTWHKSQQLSVSQALATYTINAAFANRQENSLGSLEKDKWADFILLDQDIFQINNNDIWKTKVQQTWVAGKQIFSLSATTEQEKTFTSSLEK